jgi:predicted dehydrogenase
MLQLGVAGVGQQFSSYRETLRRLRNPVEIDAVYDGVFARAETVADEEDVAWETGLQALARRHSVEAVLLFDSRWHGLAGLYCLARCDKPVFVAPWLGGSAADFERLYEAATEQGVTLMPALWRRYVPTALRVRELFATEIGDPTEIRIELLIDSTGHPTLLSEVLVGWLDFCRNLFRTFPVASRLESSATHSANLIVEYPGGSSDADSESVPNDESGDPASPSAAARVRRAVLQLRTSGEVDPMETLRSTLLPLSLAGRTGENGVSRRGEIVPVRIACERGSAEIRSASEIAWQAGDQPLESETLTADRSEYDIMLDLFCRRVAGGLIPVPDYFDVSNALRIVEQAVSTADFV